MEFLTGLLGNGILGGIIGGIGGIFTAWTAYKDKKEERAYKLAEAKNKRDHEIKLLGAETEANIKEIEAGVQRDRIMMEGKADVEESIGRTQAVLKLSENTIKEPLLERMMFNGSKYTKWLTMPLALFITFLHSIIDMLRTLVRVVITYGSVAFSCYITYLCFDMYIKLGITLDAKDLYNILMTMLKLLTFTTTTAISFWFMDKSMSRKFQDNYK